MLKIVFGFIVLFTLAGGSLAAAPKAATLPLSVVDSSKAKAKLTIVEFSAPWCISCKKLKPTVSKLEKQYGKKLKVVHLNVEDKKTEALAEKYGIVSIPTFMFYGAKSNLIRKVETDLAPDGLTKLVKGDLSGK